jgi:hypothetical protein
MTRPKPQLTQPQPVLCTRIAAPSTLLIMTERRISPKEEKAIAQAKAKIEINRTITKSCKPNSSFERTTSATDTEVVEDFPPGYPQLAAFQSSESSFSIYRAFDYLHARVIVEMQDELRMLEDKLGKLDVKDDNETRAKCLSSRSWDARQAKEDGKLCSERTTLLSKIRDKLVSYDEILMKARDIGAFQRPSNRDYRSLRQWFYNEGPLSYAREAEFIKRKEDLRTLRHGREWAGFDGWMEDSIRKLPRGLARVSSLSYTQGYQRDMNIVLTTNQWLFTTPELRDKTKDKHIYYFSPSRVEKLVGLIITLIIFILLVLPVVAMYKLTSVGDRNSTFDAIGILVVFTMLFCAAMSLLTKAKRHELFAASAAYCAVLVVFISNFSNASVRS